MIVATTNNLLHATSLMEQHLLKNHIFSPEINLEHKQIFKLLDLLVKYENRKVKLMQLVDNYNVFDDNWNDFYNDILGIENKVISCILKKDFSIDNINLIKNNFWLIDGLIKVKLMHCRIHVGLLKGAEKKGDEKNINNINSCHPRMSCLSNVRGSTENNSLSFNNSNTNNIDNTGSQIKSGMTTDLSSSEDDITKNTTPKSLTNKERKAEQKGLQSAKTEEIKKKQIEKFKLKSQVDSKKIIDDIKGEDYEKNAERNNELLKEPGKSFINLIGKEVEEGGLDFAQSKLCIRHFHEVIHEHQKKYPQYSILWVFDIFGDEEIPFDKMKYPPKTPEEINERNNFINKWRKKWINESNLRGNIEWEQYWTERDLKMRKIYSKLTDTLANPNHNQKVALNH